ncbi:hypothetical protein EK21DRAFT_110638 [Setomelanomma holmii]|uniref:Uncharacterized protein n=1 Tax=Setomelanomma holmii TaxID=210430 RepID=A0A9P4LPH6_9PLEO|nr:hypothetical protein EK21DRAFT_110638 [Setomelanomma holmii]
MATLIFVPGHWNTPACYDAFLTCLTNYTYSSATVILPHPGCDAATYDFTRERDDFKRVMTALASTRRDVILVLHPSHPRSSVKRQEKKHMERSLVTGVSRMIFFMAHFDSEGFEDIQDESKDFADFELERGTVTVDEHGAMKVYFQYLPECEAQHWAARMLPQSVGEFQHASTYTGWQSIPSTYVCHSNGIRSFRVPFAYYKIEKTRELSGVH